MTIPATPSGAKAAVTRSQAEVWANWEERARNVLVDAMKCRRMSYKALSRELEKWGIDETPDQLNRKVNRRKFSAAFYLVCLQAIASNQAVEDSLVRPGC